MSLGEGNNGIISGIDSSVHAVWMTGAALGGNAGNAGIAIHTLSGLALHLDTPWWACTTSIARVEKHNLT